MKIMIPCIKTPKKMNIDKGGKTPYILTANLLRQLLSEFWQG